MYVDKFIPYLMYVCMYVNTFTVCDICIHYRAGPAVIFRSHSSTVKRLKIAATPHFPVYRLLFAVDAATVQPRVFTAIPALNDLAACMYVCMLESNIILFLIYVNVFVCISQYNVRVCT